MSDLTIHLRHHVRLSTFGSALGLLALSALSPAPAAAYCRTSSCADCPRDPDTGCVIGGEPIAWPGACVSYSLNEAASSAVDLDTASALVAQAFAIWQAAPCDAEGGHPSIEAFDAFGPVQCELAQYNPRGKNANLIVFRDVRWPYANPGSELGLTTITTNGKTAEIYDADIEINATLPLTLEGGSVQKGLVVGSHDLLSILIHEIGHFLGLDHSRAPEAIMQLDLPPGAVRTVLSADDVAAICAAYPPDRKVPKCDETPRGGLSETCQASAPSSADSGCSVASGAREPGLFHGLLALVGVSCAFRRRRSGRACSNSPRR